jgi:hypothetical protein
MASEPGLYRIYGHPELLFADDPEALQALAAMNVDQKVSALLTHVTIMIAVVTIMATAPSLVSALSLDPLIRLVLIAELLAYLITALITLVCLKPVRLAGLSTGKRWLPLIMGYGVGRRLSEDEEIERQQHMEAMKRNKKKITDAKKKIFADANRKFSCYRIAYALNILLTLGLVAVYSVQLVGTALTR